MGFDWQLFLHRGRLPPRVERRVNASFLYWVGSMGLTTGGVVLASNVLHYVDLRNCKPVWVSNNWLIIM